MSKEEKEAIDYLQFCYDVSTIEKESLPKLGIANAIANGKYIANLYGEGSIGYYKIYSMIDLINKQQKVIKQKNRLIKSQQQYIKDLEEREEKDD